MSELTATLIGPPGPPGRSKPGRPGPPGLQGPPGIHSSLYLWHPFYTNTGNAKFILSFAYHMFILKIRTILRVVYC